MYPTNLKGADEDQIWEPTISSLLQEQGGMIEEIWALDCVNQGAASVLNEEDLGNTCTSSLPSSS